MATMTIKFCAAIVLLIKNIGIFTVKMHLTTVADDGHKYLQGHDQNS
jgi:hypothetical protein